MSSLVHKIEAAQIRADRPDLRPGDTIEVSIRASVGVGFERTFPLHGPSVSAPRARCSRRRSIRGLRANPSSA